jgi:dephospho-CoA kinase
MKKIGLTGGIGSGKSTVADIFRQLGIPVFNSDEVARKLQDENEEVKNGIKKIFGDTVYDDNGKLIRKKIASIVFSDKNKLEQLNAVVHPAVGKAFEQFCEENKQAKYILKEAAILFEIGDEKNLDEMILVAAPEEVRVQRVVARDGISKEEVLSRMKNQWSQKEKIKLANYVIVNDRKELVLPQVVSLNEELSE